MNDLVISITGQVTHTNFNAWREQMLARIASVKTELATDEDFAEAQEQVKNFKVAEKALDEAKVSAQEQSADIHRLFHAIDQVKARIRATRLTLNRQVTARKSEIKNALVNQAIHEVREYIQLRDEDYNIINSSDFTQRYEYTEAIKGKSSLNAAKHALETLCNTKRSQVNAQLQKAAINAKNLDAIQEQYLFLFPDKKTLLRMCEEELDEVIKKRIGEYQRKAQEPTAQTQVPKIETQNEGSVNDTHLVETPEPTSKQTNRLSLLKILEPLAKGVHPIDGRSLTELDYEPIGELLSAVSEILNNLSKPRQKADQPPVAESSTVKRILVLANSSKSPGRCVAGIEILSETPEGISFGDFIRPIDMTQPEGSIKDDTATINGCMVRPMDILDLEVCKQADDPNHPEDWIICQGSDWQLRGRLSVDRLKELPHAPMDRWGRDKAIVPGSAKTTIQLIKTNQKLHVHGRVVSSSTGHLRAEKRLHFNGLDISVTDTEFIERHGLDQINDGNGKVIEIEEGSFIVLSLTPPFEPYNCGTKYQYRVAAAIIQRHA